MNIYEGGSFVVGQQLNSSDGIDRHANILLWNTNHVVLIEINNGII